MMNVYPFPYVTPTHPVAVRFLREHEMRLYGTPLARPTFPEIADLQPGVLALLALARDHRHDDPDYCADEVFAVRFAPLVIALVGWFAADRRLRSEQAYDVARQTIRRALPPCPHTHDGGTP